jgi:hypothetical protein
VKEIEMAVIMEWEIGLENGHKDVNRMKKVIVQYKNEDSKML